jgi:hypothetical protein
MVIASLGPAGLAHAGGLEGLCEIAVLCASLAP